MIVADNAKRIIEEKGLKQSFVATRACYHVKTFNAMLNGRKVIKDIDVLRIANALEVTPNELFGMK